MIRLEDVTKEYGGWAPRARGRVRALEGVTLVVPPGSALGVVGPNGAGKSTLMRLLLGYLRPTRGSVQVGGLAPRAYAERHGVAYVPDTVAVPPGWTVRGALEAFAALGEVAEPHARVEAEMERLGIAELAGRRVGALSKGNLQRLGIAQALLGERKVMVLDEPATGLDPEWIARLREIVAAWRAGDRERVLVMASHDLDEVERMVDRVAVLEAGRVRETIDLRAAESFPAYRLAVAGEGAAAAVHALFPEAVAAEGTPLEFRVRADGLAELNRRVAALLARGVSLVALHPERASLEERVRRTRGGKGAR
jgi:ABC-2 type transport system ATP-binding protein